MACEVSLAVYQDVISNISCKRSKLMLKKLFKGINNKLSDRIGNKIRGCWGSRENPIKQESPCFLIPPHPHPPSPPPTTWVKLFVVTCKDLASSTVILSICLWGVASRHNKSRLSCRRTRHSTIFKPKSSAATSCFHIYSHKLGHLLLLQTLYTGQQFCASSLSSVSKQTLIYNSHDLLSIRAPPSTQPIVYTCARRR